MSKKVGGIYVSVDGDTTAFSKSMKALQSQAGKQGDDIAKSFNSSFAGPVQSALRDLNRNFTNAVKNINFSDIEIPVDKISDMAKQIGLTEDKYKDLAERMMQNNAFEQASKNLQRIAKSANLTDKEMFNLAKDMGFSEDQMKRLRAELNRTDKQFKNVGDSVSSLAKKFALPLVSVAALKKGVSGIVSSLQEISRMGDLAQSANMIVEDFDRLSYYAGTAGVSVEAFRDSWLNFQKAAATSNGQEAFKQLRIDTKELIGMRPDKQLKTVADALQNINQSARVDLANKLFGGNAKEFLSLLSEGGTGLDKLGERYDKAGKSISSVDVQKAKQAAEAVDDMKSAISSLGRELAISGAPMVRFLADLGSSLLGAARQTDLSKLNAENVVGMSLGELDIIKERIESLQQSRQALIDSLGKPIDIKANQSVGWNGSPELAQLDISAMLKDNIKEITKFKEELAGLDVLAKTVSDEISKKEKEIADAAKEAAKAYREQEQALAAAKQAEDLAKLRDSLEDTVFALEYANDPIMQLNREIEKLVNNPAYDSALDSLVDRLYDVRIAAIDAKKPLTEDQKFQTRLQFWSQYADNALAASGDIIISIEKQRDAFIDAGIAEVDAARWVSREKLKYATDWTSGAQRALIEYGKNAGDISKSVETALSNAFNNAENALVNFVMNGKFEFKDFINSILSDLARLAVRQSITVPLAGALGGLFSGTAHTGGVAGNLTSGKMVSPLVFADAPRFHTGGLVGLNPGEVPIIAKRGEGVFTPEQMKALGTGKAPQVNVNVVNNTDSRVNVKQQYNGNGEVSITAYVDDAMAANAGKRGSNFNRTMQSSRQLVRR